MKVNKSCRTNITWKVKFWVMPALYLLAWGRNAYVLASPQAMTIGISAFLLMNLCIFCLLFKSQFNRVRDSVVNVLFIKSVISRKFLFSFLTWVALTVIGCSLGVIGFIVFSVISMWVSAFVFLFSNSVDLNIISPGFISANEVKQSKSKAYDYCGDIHASIEKQSFGVNPTTGLAMINGVIDTGGNAFGIRGD